VAMAELPSAAVTKRVQHAVVWRPRVRAHGLASADRTHP
jgi:hypothetical protein